MQIWSFYLYVKTFFSTLLILIATAPEQAPNIRYPRYFQQLRALLSAALFRIDVFCQSEQFIVGCLRCILTILSEV